MTRQLAPIFAIFLGSAFLMVAGGLNGLILPLRGSDEGFSTLSLGLLGTGWAIGYVMGCINTPRLVRRAGHVRTFGVMAALAVISVLLSLLIVEPGTWITLRAVTGFAFAGGAMIVESWLNERTDNRFRGRVFGIYTMLNLGATMAGQMLVSIGDTGGHVFFVLAAVFYALALIPTSISTAAAPKPLIESGLDLKALVQNSPVAVVSVFLVGVSNSSFGTLGVVFGDIIGLSTTTIALMMSVSLMAGALFQIPVGYLSDRTDRRYVLVGLAALAAVIDLLFIIVTPTNQYAVLAATALFGAAIYSAYPVIIAHASDHAKGTNFIKISGGLLLIYGIGGIFGPLYSGMLMAAMPQTGLFAATLSAHVVIILYGIYRISKRTAVEAEDRGVFVGTGPGRLNTPETAALDPRGQTGAAADWADRLE